MEPIQTNHLRITIPIRMGAIITRMIMAPVTTIVVGVIPTTLLLRDPLVLHPRHPEAVVEEAQENKWSLDFQHNIYV